MDLSVLSDATLEQLANGQTPDPSKLTDQELEYLAENPPEIKSNVGGVESFARGAANNFPLAPQAIAGLSKGDYSQNLEDWNAKAAEAKAANPMTYGAGAVAGSVAPLAIPGVGGALKAAPVAGNALYGAASAISNIDLAKHPEEALKEGAKGAAIGGATAGLLGKILPTEAGMGKFANREAVKTAGLKPSMLGGKGEQEIQGIGEFMRANNLLAGDLNRRVQTAQGLTREYGQKIEAMGADTIAGKRVNTEPLHAIAKKYAASVNPEAKKLTSGYLAGIQDLQNLGEHPTFGQMMALKKVYGSLAFNADHSVKNAAAKDVYFQLKDAIAKTVDASPGEYQAALKGYSLASDVEEGLTRQHGVQVASGDSHTGVGGHGLHSLIKQIPGVTNPAVAVPGGVALAAMGHPVIGATLGLHSMMATPQARSNVAANIGKVAGPVGNALKMAGTDALVSHFLSNPSAYGKFSAPLMEATQKGGKQGFAATSFVLRQQHPELNDIMLKGGKDNDDQTSEMPSSR
jgi:hypothetical protein